MIVTIQHSLVFQKILRKLLKIKELNPFMRLAGPMMPLGKFLSVHFSLKREGRYFVIPDKAV